METINAAMKYAAIGWKIVQLYGIGADGKCTCGRAHDERSAGKHPVGKGWASSATSDEETISEWPELANIGLLLGPDSGVIDVEFDCEEGRLTAEELFAGIITPTYQSGRSIHRLFRWTESLPPVQKMEIRGLEVRIGGAGKSTQSVLPPSRHYSGREYRWLAGLSPDDCDPIEIPAALAELMGVQKPAAGAQGLPGSLPPSQPEQGECSRGRAILEADAVREGERNDILFAFACREVNFRNIANSDARADLLEIVLGMNALRCSPPLDRSEVEQIVASACRIAREGGSPPPQALPSPPSGEGSQMGSPGVSGAPRLKGGDGWHSCPPQRRHYLEHGLAYGPDPEDGQGFGWHPGDWQLTVVKSDPVAYVLTVPAWINHVANDRGDIHLTLEQFTKADKMAEAVLSATKVVLLSDRPRAWSAVWNGEQGRKGLKARLMDERQEAEPDIDQVEGLVLIQHFLTRLDNAPETEDDRPASSGEPVKLSDGSIAFAWVKLFRALIDQGQFTEPNIRSAKSRIFAIPKRQTRQYQIDGVRLNITKVSPDDIARIRKMYAMRKDS